MIKQTSKYNKTDKENKLVVTSHERKSGKDKTEVKDYCYCCC